MKIISKVTGFILELLGNLFSIIAKINPLAAVSIVVVLVGAIGLSIAAFFNHVDTVRRKIINMHDYSVPKGFDYLEGVSTIDGQSAIFASDEQYNLILKTVQWGDKSVESTKERIDIDTNTKEGKEEEEAFKSLDRIASTSTTYKNAKKELREKFGDLTKLNIENTKEFNTQTKEAFNKLSKAVNEYIDNLEDVKKNFDNGDFSDYDLSEDDIDLLIEVRNKIVEWNNAKSTSGWLLQWLQDASTFGDGNKSLWDVKTDIDKLLKELGCSDIEKNDIYTKNKE